MVHGRVPDALRFTDAKGRDLSNRADPSDVILEAPPVVARATTSAIVEFKQLPGEVDMAWWARNGHLLHWSERRGFEFRAGLPSESVGDGSVARAAPKERLSDLVGHERIRRSLATSAMAALKTGEPAPHVLLAGPPGLGKTSLARAMAGELGRPFRATSGPALEEIGVLVRLLTTLAKGEVVFIDELHRMPARVCEMLYEAMEEGTLSLPVSCGSRATTIRIRLHPFTLIGATSEVARLPAPFHSRFVYREHLTFYGLAEITEILQHAARRDGFELSLGAARRLARASRDTPREAVALLAALREEASLNGCTAIGDAVAREVLDRLGIDPDGLTPQERDYLRVLGAASRPLGRKALAKRLGVSPGVVDDSYEPYPARRGMVEFTRYGRVLAR
jgi:Holliday junction DNA helicase RuvB